MRDILYTLMTCVLASNVIFVRFEGLCGFLGSTAKKSSAVYMSLSTAFVITAAAAVNWLLYNMVLVPLNAAYLETVIYLFVIACLVQLCENLSGRLSVGLKKELGINPVLILTNSAVISVCLENAADGQNLVMSVFTAFSIGLGYIFATILFGGISSRLDNESIPACFRGIPALLIAAAIVSLAFYGFEGVIVGIFGM